MILRLNRLFWAGIAGLALSAPANALSGSQSAEGPAPAFAGIDSLSLPPAQTAALSQALAHNDYVGAEKILLPQIQLQDRSKHTARLLSFMGGVYYLDHDYLHAAVAWKKSEAIEPLEPAVQFSLAMSYIELGHRDWARAVLQTLCTRDAKKALYPYWLGRLDYDAHAYSQAILHFQQAIALDSAMARAYDNLGLCYFHQNQNDLAIQSFEHAITLESQEGHPSAWPYLNLAVTQQLLDRNSDAETNLREAIRLDPGFAQAYYQLGNVLEHEQHPVDAIAAWRKAAQINPAYAEPHFALARIYRKQGDNTAAKQEVQIYLRLHRTSSAPAASR